MSQVWSEIRKYAASLLHAQRLSTPHLVKNSTRQPIIFGRRKDGRRVEKGNRGIRRPRYLSSFVEPLQYEPTGTFREGRPEYRLLKAFVYEVGAIGSGLSVSVPAGFVTDFASVPSKWDLIRGLIVLGLALSGAAYTFSWSSMVLYVATGFYCATVAVTAIVHVKIKPHGKYSQAAALHDYLYLKGVVSRWMCDRILFEAMQPLNVNYATRVLIYYAVRVGGWRYYDRKNLAVVQLQHNAESDSPMEVVPQAENTYVLEDVDDSDIGF